MVVIGGGDTGSDCIGTSNRQGALSVTQLEILAKPPVTENKSLVWPDWPLKLRTSSSQEEGAARDWSVQTRRAIVDDGRLAGLECVRVEWKLGDGGKMNLVEVPGSEFVLKADLVLLAMGFVGPRRQGLIEQAGVGLDARGNVKADTLSYKTSARQDFLLRRHAARPISGGMGDPRGPAMRARCGRVFDGQFGTASVVFLTPSVSFAQALRDTSPSSATREGEAGLRLYL